jgi:hypothetical protein
MSGLGKPATPVAPVAPVAAPSAPVGSVEASNPFTLLLGDQQGRAVPSQMTATPTLLAPFAGGAGLLAAFVMAEALGLPLALRER